MRQHCVSLLSKFGTSAFEAGKSKTRSSSTLMQDFVFRSGVGYLGAQQLDTPAHLRPSQNQQCCEQHGLQVGSASYITATCSFFR
jgi:hypothetical protein